MPARKILITGGAGFIGSNLATHLLRNRDIQLTILDNLSSGRLQNLTELLDRIRFIQCDICDYDFTQLEDHDEIYHLACQASPPFYQKDPLHTLDTCYLGTRNILQFAKRCGAKVVFSSTSEIYGDPLVHPQTESYTGNVNTATARACYDEGKRVAETLCYEYSRWIEVKVARIFNTYGPHMSPADGRIVSNFINQALMGHPMTIYGEGLQTRSLCYVDDTVNALIRYMTTETGTFEVINIGHEYELTIKEIALFINEILKLDTPFTFLPLPEADPKQRQAAIGKARKILNWEPATTLEEGLQRTIEYFQTISSAPIPVSNTQLFDEHIGV